MHDILKKCLNYLFYYAVSNNIYEQKNISKIIMELIILVGCFGHSY